MTEATKGTLLGAMDAAELNRLAEDWGTPTFVFDIDAFQDRLRECKQIVGESVALCYAMKANPWLINAAAEVVDRLEVCSPGELDLCMRAGIAPEQIVYSGVNKLPEDINTAIEYGAGVLTAESLLHARYIEQVAAERDQVVDVLPRLNAGSQFGMCREDLLWLVDNRAEFPHLNLVGIHYFVGTQRKKLKHQVKELGMLMELIDELAAEHGFEVQRLEYGPGLGVPYFADDDFSDTLAPLREMAELFQQIGSRVQLTVEMGRFFAAPCGTYLTRVMDKKSNKGTNYVILDGGMNHLTYYGQMMGLHVPVIENVTRDCERPAGAEAEVVDWTLCGSLCTINDVLVRSVELADLQMGDVLAFHNAGAYSVTEGVYLFLSRTMPRIVLRTGNAPAQLARDFMETSVLNGIA